MKFRSSSIQSSDVEYSIQISWDEKKNRNIKIIKEKN